MTLEGWKFPEEKEARMMRAIELREEINMAEQELSALEDILADIEELEAKKKR